MAAATHYNSVVPKHLSKLLLLLLAIGTVQFGCARDVNDPNMEAPYPNEVSIAFQTRAAFDPNYWYFIVFNRTAAPDTTPQVNPIDRISNEDRAAGWERFIAFNTANPPTLVTLQRPNFPTVLPTAREPVDAASGDFNSDDRTDVVIACRTGGVVQIVVGEEVTILETIFFENPEDIPNASGPNPLRVGVSDWNGDGEDDMLVIYEGDGETEPFYQFFAGDAGIETFTPGTAVTIPATPVDAIFQDVNTDGNDDIVLLTSGPDAGDNAVRFFLSDGAGEFTADLTLDAGTNPVGISFGEFTGSQDGIVVADRVSNAAGEVIVYTSDAGLPYEELTTLPVAGKLNHAAIGTVFGTVGDVVIAFENADGAGATAVYLREAGSTFENPQAALLLSEPGYIVSLDTNNDNRDDFVLVDGQPGPTGQTLYIARSGSFVPEGQFSGEFEFEEELITYATGQQPTRIIPAQLDNNGVTDFIVPGSGDIEGGDNISLFYGLGKSNYTNADIYWTDQLPEPLINQEWYLEHVLLANQFLVRIDPALFFDQARLAPDDDGFNINIFTATTGIDLDRNPDQDGEVRDFLERALNIPMDIDFIEDEQTIPLSNGNIVEDEAEIDFWEVVVQ